MPSARITILSPHFDDAVLSCWHLLDGSGEVDVVNVFTGVPPADAHDGWWDVASGAADSQTRMAERRAEDRAALAGARRAAIHLDLLDEQYRSEALSLDQVTERIAAVVDRSHVLYAPAAFSQGEDHALVRSAVRQLARRGWSACLYADFPHALRLGRPSSLNGSGPRTDADAMWDERLRGILVAPRPRVQRLEPEALERKLDAVRAYGTQIDMLEQWLGVALDATTLDREVVWELSDKGR